MAKEDTMIGAIQERKLKINSFQYPTIPYIVRNDRDTDKRGTQDRVATFLGLGSEDSE